MSEWPLHAEHPDTKKVENGREGGINWAILGVQIPGYGSYLTGYVQIPADHVWYGMAYDDVPVSVHGGLTYGVYERGPMNVRELMGELLPEGMPEVIPGNSRTLEETGGWIGFDTGHFGDTWDPLHLAEIGLDPVTTAHRFRDEDRPWQTKWTIDRMRAEVHSLAHQVSRVYITEEAR